MENILFVQIQPFGLLDGSELLSISVRFGDLARMVLLSILLIPLGSAHGSELWESRTVNSWFSSKSIWNIPVGSDATFEDVNSPATMMLHNENAGGGAKSYAWIAADSVPVYQAKSTDPQFVWKFERRSATGPWINGGPYSNGTFELRAPESLQFTGFDQYAIVITEDGKFAYEVWKGEKDSRHQINVRYVAMNKLDGTGIPALRGRSEGIRAFGGSLLGGLILCKEMEERNIPHGIAMLLSPSQLRAGKTMDDQLVWPASSTDNSGHNSYSGLIPMGALVAIPKTVDLDKLDLSPDGKTLARAYQLYGGYVTDAAHNTMILANLELGCENTYVTHLQADKRKILAQLRVVSNNSSATPGGPGERLIVDKR
ncbi:hypothetical protein ACQZ4Y_20075 [Rhizobium sp. L80/93]|uniref:hypothetical protein n=1 Tax=Rhizobium sp. E27B/91 TaxID=2819995 RepID=UPI001ADCF127|nr:hypothetical protein [Rhizobium sp. E27B/91]MBO9186795.1 hypothetical protein [Rhizobium sp. E27B/91]